jgi:ABC-type transport system involved in multi-copper enzyme maturation permease subunit
MDLPISDLFVLGFTLPVWVKPLWGVVAAGAGVILALFLLLQLLRLVVPKIVAIAWTTGKEAISQPLFYVILAVGMFLLVLSLFLPYFTFGEDVKVVEENGLTLIMLMSVVLALWTASVSVSDEIEGRTALTVLCKPISRRQFILGKFLGILGPVVILFVILGVIFLSSVSFKVVYDARENAAMEPGVIECQAEILQIAPGLVLAFFEAVVMTSISVAISTRLPMLPNLVICLSVYVLGHLVPMLAGSAAGQLPMVGFIGDLLSTVLPVLDHFNIYGAISTGQEVKPVYLAWSAAYCLLYSIEAMLLGLLLFEDRDLA